MAHATLDYALPHNRRRRWQILLLLLATIAAGIVGKLCWDKFGEPIRARLAIQRTQKLIAAHTWQGLEHPVANRDLVTRKAFEDGLGQAVMQMSNAGAPQGFTLYFGQSGEGSDRRYLLLTATQTDSTAVSSLTLVARVFSAATLWNPPRQLGDAQIFPFLTFRKSFLVDPVKRSKVNPHLFVLTGAQDQIPFRFELTVDGNNRVNLVEDPTVSSTSTSQPHGDGRPVSIE